MAEYKRLIRYSHRTGSKHVFTSLKAIELGADKARCAYPARYRHCEYYGEHTCAEHQHEQNGNDHVRHAVQNLCQMRKEYIYLASAIAGYSAVYNAYHKVYRNGYRGDYKRYARAAEKPCKQVASQIVRAEPMIFAVCHAAVLIIVNLYVAHGNVLNVVLVKNLDNAAFRISVGIVKLILAAVCKHAGTIEYAKLFKPGYFWGQILLRNILLSIGIPCDIRHYYGHQHDQQYYCAGDHGYSVLAEPYHCILEEADGFSFKLFVLYIFLMQGFKIGIGQIFNIVRQIISIINHAFLPPTRTRGSIRP